MNKAMEAARGAEWKKSIFATNKFSSDLRRNNVVRGIFNEGFDAGWNARGSQWVAVSERLPDVPLKMYRVTTKGGSVQKAWFRGDIWLDDHNARDGVRESIGVIAWMPIIEPEPYTADSGQEV